ncbi:MAG: hypothetical protein RLZZ396_1383 [Planctomycetota bacterium]
MGIDVVVPDIAVDLLSLPIGKLTDRMQRDVRFVEKDPVVEVQPSSLLDLIADDFQSIFDLRTIHTCTLFASITLFASGDLSKPRVEGPCPEDHDADYGVELKKCQLHPIERPLRNYRVFVNQQGSYA